MLEDTNGIGERYSPAIRNTRKEIPTLLLFVATIDGRGKRKVSADTLENNGKQSLNIMRQEICA